MSELDLDAVERQLIRAEADDLQRLEWDVEEIQIDEFIDRDNDVCQRMLAAIQRLRKLERVRDKAQAFVNYFPSEASRDAPLLVAALTALEEPTHV